MLSSCRVPLGLLIPSPDRELMFPYKQKGRGLSPGSGEAEQDGSVRLAMEEGRSGARGGSDEDSRHPMESST